MSQIILYDNEDNKLKYFDRDDVLDAIYFQRARLPNKQQIETYLKNKTDLKIKKYFQNKSVEEQIKKIQKKISKIDLKIPLYDEFSRNIYLIDRSNVYQRVVYQSYRFPDDHMLQVFKKRKKQLEPKIKKSDNKKEKNLGEFEKITKMHYIKMNEREYHKLELMIDFMEQFDLEVLKDTYVKAFYYYANEVGKNITVCLRPSFLPHFRHISPYYSRSELINLALNLEIIKPSGIFYDQDKLMELCDKIKENDISADIILSHQKHIIKNNMIGGIQYYSLEGAYFMNEYLRNRIPYEYKNPALEKEIRAVWELIREAPAFDKGYTLYRFVHSDTHLRHLEIGSVYEEPSFISTTRDPFYRSDIYRFGFILLKIKIPSHKKGVGLCLETFSHFPKEEEIILPPRTKLRLDRVDNDVPYYHTDDHYESKIKTRYEFSLIDNEPISFDKRPIYDDHKIIDFMDLRKKETITMEERIKQFISNNTNPYFMFKTKIGDQVYEMFTEWYDSMEAYKEFYASRTNHGFAMYTFINHYIGLMIELGESDDQSFAYVNYYFRYSSVPKEGRIKDDDLLKFLAKLGLYFEVNKVIIYAEYESCDFARLTEELKDEIKTRGARYGGNYCTDIYHYLKSGTKRYSDVDSTEIKAKFSYFELDRLKKTDPIKILRKEDPDELYQIYTRTYRPLLPNEAHNLASFYVWLVENYCSNVRFLVEKLDRFYNRENPFLQDFYILNPVAYLYNRNIIDYYPTFSSSSSEPELTTDGFPKNKYRVSTKREGRDLSSIILSV